MYALEDFIMPTLANQILGLLAEGLKILTVVLRSNGRAPRGLLPNFIPRGICSVAQKANEQFGFVVSKPRPPAVICPVRVAE
jgi:hypothetical protein